MKSSRNYLAMSPRYLLYIQTLRTYLLIILFRILICKYFNVLYFFKFYTFIRNMYKYTPLQKLYTNPKQNPKQKQKKCS